ncbi:hypothetical protein DBR39_18960 [Chryseobacterium sp. KBW03]|jgi:hypothetical protein|uniref:hypothetical protein n=1 Tax=Chryseobacterium sp. KBW03 TaxID=2153362 RepID=UPI000F59D811|nr:hypothetical protein [Chryseobacterium sp. KBW03]RQO35397.1 hypothetical protein DBR39_18960 [Chryseobacterium sp. KBW03]
MTEGIFGLLGVLIGSFITWYQNSRSQKKEAEKNARYLAIRIVCVLDRYLQECVDVVKDDGLDCGQRMPDGCLKPQVKIPSPLIYPDDVDWKSIDPELMFKLLSFPSEIEEGNRMINFAGEIAGPPDYEEWFVERKVSYSQFGLMAFKMSEELADRYHIKKKTYNNWNPVTDLTGELKSALKDQKKLEEEQREIIKRILG